MSDPSRLNEEDAEGIPAKHTTHSISKGLSE